MNVGEFRGPSGQELQEWSVLWEMNSEESGLRSMRGSGPENRPRPSKGQIGVCMRSVWFVALGQWAFSHHHLEMEERFVYQTGPPPVVIAVGLKVDAGL